MGDNMDYSSPEQQREAVRAKFKRPTGFQPGHPPIFPKTEEARQRQLDGLSAARERGKLHLTPFKEGEDRTLELASKGGTRLAEIHRDAGTRGTMGFENMPKERRDALRKQAQENSGGMPIAQPGSNITMESSYKSFAKKIRSITNDGWELVDVVHTILRDSFEEKQYDRAINAATWLADRGFGKPVQVTALTDAEGNPVAFQLWQPAANEQGDAAEEPPLVITQYAKPSLDLSAPPTPAENQPDRFALGPARIWGVNQDKEQIDE